MKNLLALVATLFAVSAFAQTAPAPAKKEEAKPAVAAPAKAATPAKSEAKAPVTKDAKATK